MPITKAYKTRDGSHLVDSDDALEFECGERIWLCLECGALVRGHLDTCPLCRTRQTVGFQSRTVVVAVDREYGVIKLGVM